MKKEEIIGGAVRDICDISVAPAAKSKVRRIVERVFAEGEKKGEKKAYLNKIV